MIQGKAEELHDGSRSDAFLRIHLLLNPKNLGSTDTLILK